MIKSRWAMLQRIGSGGFGSIFKAYDTEKNTNVAIKVEKRQGKCHLDKEVVFYGTIEKHRRPGVMSAVPRCHYSGVEGGFKIAVFDLMGESLSDLFYRCGRRFSLKTVLMLAQQLVSRLESVHEAGIVHRDVKPGNFVMGRGDEANTVFVIDFGLSNLWLTSGKHIPFNTESPFRGTHRYASVNSHMKFEQSRRDDLEAVAYVLIYFLKGGLPWQSLKVSRSKRRKAIGKYKASVSPETLCANLPLQFTQFLIYVKTLAFDAEPDYQYCRDLFRSAFEEGGFEDDGVWDWDLLPAPLPATAQLQPLADGLVASAPPQSNANLVHNTPPAAPTFSISQTLAHYMQQQAPAAPSSPPHPSTVPHLPRGTPHATHANIVPSVAPLPPVAHTHTARHPAPPTHTRTTVSGMNTPVSVSSGTSSPQHRPNSPCVNLGASLSPIPLPLTSRPNVGTLPKARINIMANDFPSTFSAVGNSKSAVSRSTPALAPTVAHTTTGLRSNSATGAVPHAGFIRLQTTSKQSYTPINESHMDYLASSTPQSHQNMPQYATSMVEMELAPQSAVQSHSRQGTSPTWPSSTPAACSSSPMLGSTKGANGVFSGKLRLSSSASAGIQRSVSPQEPMLDFLDEDMVFANSNASMASNSVATSSVSYSSVSSGALSSSSSTVSGPPSLSSTGAIPAPGHLHSQHRHYSTMQHGSNVVQVHTHAFSAPASPSSSVHPDSPIHMAVDPTADALLWGSAAVTAAEAAADVLAETSYISNATTTTECLSVCAYDATTAPSSCGSTTLTLANEGTMSTSSSPSSGSPNAKKRARTADSHLSDTLPEPVCKRRSARLLANK